MIITWVVRVRTLSPDSVAKWPDSVAKWRQSPKVTLSPNRPFLYYCCHIYISESGGFSPEASEFFLNELMHFYWKFVLFWDTSYIPPRANQGGQDFIRKGGPIGPTLATALLSVWCWSYTVHTYVQYRIKSISSIHFFAWLACNWVVWTPCQWLSQPDSVTACTSYSTYYSIQRTRRLKQAWLSSN